MKNVSLIINAVLIIAVGILFYNVYSLKCTQNTNCDNKTLAEASADEIIDVSKYFNVAYINADSLLLAYDYAKKLSEKLKADSERKESNFLKREDALLKKREEYQKIIEKGGFITEEQYADFQKEEYELQHYGATLQQEFANIQLQMNQELNDTLVNYLKEFNADGKYQYVLSSVGFFYGQANLDITDTVINALNQRYALALANNKK